MTETVKAANVYERLERARDAVASRCAVRPRAALVLGSGLGALADQLDGAVRIPYRDIPGMPVSAIEGHAGTLVMGQLAGVPVVVLSGRVHAYEGHGLDAVVFGVRLCRMLGAREALLTNAAGGLHSDLAPGDLMVIRDHIHLLAGSNPLQGANDERLGVRFPDMTRLYDQDLRRLLRAAGEAEGVTLRSGVYVCVPGPSYETPAEIRMLRILGADAVGMSTTAEAIAAHHAGLRVVGLSCITNLAAGLAEGLLSHEEVKEVALQVGDRMRRVVLRLLRSLPPAEAQ